MTTSSGSSSRLLPGELKLISDAAEYLENPSLLMQMANALGKPVESLLKVVDKVAPGRVEDVVAAALRTALQVAVYTLPNRADDAVEPRRRNDGEPVVTPSFLNKMSVALTGSVGGLFGVAGLALELPITTTLLLRSIASIAKDHGEDLGDGEVELQCLTVFCFGGPGKSDDAMESSYLTARFAMQEMVTHAVRSIAGLSAAELAAAIQKGSAPAIVGLIAKIAARFNVTVSQKMLAQSIPVLGAATGAAINVAFMDHFNRVAAFHFGIRSLERKYGTDVVQGAYRKAVERTKK